MSSPREEAEPDQMDASRLSELKLLIWSALKRTNEQGVRAGDFIKMIKDLKSLTNNSM
jgi:hypothetical protein